jgi:hypothetical protein
MIHLNNREKPGIKHPSFENKTQVNIGAQIFIV